jgi:hypothetical protein
MLAPFDQKKLPCQDFLSLVCLFSALEGYQFQHDLLLKFLVQVINHKPAQTALKHSALPNHPVFVPAFTLVLKMQPTPAQRSCMIIPGDAVGLANKADSTPLRYLSFFVLLTSPFLTFWC